MRTIVKGQADPALAQQHQSPPQNWKKAKRRWENFQQRHKHATRDICLKEQYYLCGYSEVDPKNHAPIGDNAGKAVSYDLGVHLEHIQPKKVVPQKIFDHNNIIVCAIDDYKKRGLPKAEVFGGHAKGNWHSPHFINPLMPSCRDYFFFDAGTGKISPSKKLSQQDHDKAELTICRLNLNSPVLMLWRKTWLVPLEQSINALLSDRSALQKFCAKRLLPDNGKLSPFHSAQRQLFGSLGKNICMQHSPPL